MKIKFVPQRNDASLAVTVNGNEVIINGFSYNFTGMKEGTTLVEDHFIAHKKDGEVSLQLPLPYPKVPTIDVTQEYEVEAEGVVEVPGHSSVQPSQVTTVYLDFPDNEFEIPLVVTMRQARLALLSLNKLADVDAAIDALPEPQKSAAKIEWEYSQEVHRNKEFVQLLAPAIGLSESDLDNLFVEASKL